MLSDAWTADHFNAELEQSFSSLDGCEIDGRLIAYICYWLVAGEMQVLNVAVEPAYRRRGIAAILLTQALARCRQQGLISAWLEVRAGNIAAIELYQQFGFTVEGRRRRYYRDGEDALLMVREYSLSPQSE